MMNIGLGTASFGTTIPEKQAHKIIDAFVKSGGSIIDTANNYAFWAGKGGESENVIGNWLKTKNREEVEIHTKIGALPVNGDSFDLVEGLSKNTIENAVKSSLTRLSTDFIDVLYAHLDDPETPLLETWSELSRLVDLGIVKRLGISNYSLKRVIELQNVITNHALQPIRYAQYRHSIIAPIKNADLGVQICFTTEMINVLKKVVPNIKLVAYSPLLDGAYEVGQTLPANYSSYTNQSIVNDIQKKALCDDVTPSALVLKMISENGIMPLTMTSKIDRLATNMALFIT